MTIHGLFLLVSTYKIKSVDFSWIRTRILRVEGEQADHLTTTWPKNNKYFERCTYLGGNCVYNNTLPYKISDLSQCLFDLLFLLLADKAMVITHPYKHTHPHTNPHKFSSLMRFKCWQNNFDAEGNLK